MLVCQSRNLHVIASKVWGLETKVPNGILGQKLHMESSGVRPPEAEALSLCAWTDGQPLILTTVGLVATIITVADSITH